MAILNIGSINIDTVFELPHIPRPGETIAASAKRMSLGGKGLNQSMAIARAGGNVLHCGAIGKDDDWIIAKMLDCGIDCRNIRRRADTPTGQAVVLLTKDSENSIVLLSGANHGLLDADIQHAISRMKPSDWVLFQNETNAQQAILTHAKRCGLRIAYAAAPFVAEQVVPALGLIDMLVMNDVEYSQLNETLLGRGELPSNLALLITKGPNGAEYRSASGIEAVPAFAVEALDTTGAGDTFLGYFLEALARNDTPLSALRIAAAASAIQVTRRGAAEAIPYKDEVLSFLETRKLSCREIIDAI